MFTRQRVLYSLILLMLLLASCNLPTNQNEQNNPNAVFTAAAQTVQAQLTQSALVSTPTIAAPADTPTSASALATDTPAPGTTEVLATNAPQPITPSPTPVCDMAEFIADVTIPDGTNLNPGDAFTKTWRLKNIGTCAWDQTYSLVFENGDQMSGRASIPLSGIVGPNQEVDLSVDLKAPSDGGSYRGYWRLSNGSGVFLPVVDGYQGKSFYVDIQVNGGNNGGSSSSFAVTHVEMSVSHGSSCSSTSYTITTSITASAAGTVTYEWQSNDFSPQNPNGSIDFSAAGTKTFAYTTQTLSGSGFSINLYIDQPNHQTFGPQTLNCP